MGNSATPYISWWIGHKLKFPEKYTGGAAFDKILPSFHYDLSLTLPDNAWCMERGKVYTSISVSHCYHHSNLCLTLLVICLPSN